jgi:hypothetical protein
LKQSNLLSACIARDQPMKLTGTHLFVAIGLVALWILATIWMALHVDYQDPAWQKLVLIFHSIETFAFAATGAILGTQVNKERAEKAEQRASTAEEAATKGKNLAAVVKAEERMRTNMGAKTTEPAPLVHPDRESLRLAKQLVPDD